MQARIRTSSVLLLCSDRNACAALIHRLQDDGHVVAVAESIEEAEEALEQSVDLLIVDGLDHPEGDGPTLLDRLPSRLDAPAILLTPDHQGTEVARALRHGAACALDSPVDVDALALTVLRTLETDRQRRVARAYQQQLATNLAELVGSSPAMQQVRALVDRVAASPTRAVLLCGEIGTGKRYCARVLHQLGPRADGPFITVNCAREQGDDLARRLFGVQRHSGSAPELERGAFELAHGGTAVLEHVERVESLDASARRHLLRLLEDGTLRREGDLRDTFVDVCLVASTSLDPRAIDARESGFLHDLFSRLGVAPITLPPLRERPEDIEIIARYMLDELRVELGGGPTNVSAKAVAALECQRWPGNLRELRNTIERAMLRAGESDTIEASHLDPPSGGAPPPRRDASPCPTPQYPLPDQGVDVHDVERSLVLQALDRTRGNLTQAGQLLGLNRDQMRYRVQKFDLGARLEQLRNTRRGTGANGSAASTSTGGN